MGGVYRVLTEGFGGLKISDKGISLFPLLPSSINEICFPFFYHGMRILVSVRKNQCQLRLMEGDPLALSIYGERIFLTEELTATRKVKGVVFDLDGVITDTASFHYLAWKKMADSMDIPFDEHRNECFKGVSRAKCFELLLSWGGKTVNEKEFAKMLKDKNDLYCKYLDSLTEESILPGIRESLVLLKTRGIPTALFSVSKNTDRILSKLNLTDSFDAIVSVNDISYSKPYYEGYLLAAQRIETDPRLCIMVEDSSAGIFGAKEVSMKTLAI